MVKKLTGLYLILFATISFNGLIAGNLNNISVINGIPQNIKNNEVISGVHSTINIMDETKETGSNPVPQDKKVSFKYDIPDKLYTGTYFIMRCILNKDGMSGGLTMTQRLPNSFEIVDIDIPGATVNVNKGNLTIIWEEMPSDSVIEILYKVKIDQHAGYLPIFTILRFSETGKRYVFDTHVNIDKMPPPGEPVSPEDMKAINKAIRESAKYASMISAKKQTVDGIIYRIQIIALRKHDYDPEYIKGKFKLNESVTKEKIEKWNKYIIGEFKTLEEAKQYREELKDYGITDAFIVKYKDGKRVR